MSARDSAAELQKLAHQLGVAPARLEFLRPVGPDDLRTLRRQIGDALFAADKHHFTKVVAVSKIVPSALSARITEHALPPLIAARTAELLEPAKAVDMVGRLSDRYLADVSAAMDPARAPEVVGSIPPDRVATVGAELARRGEWVVMGGFVSMVSPEALRASVAALDGEQLLRVGFVLDDLTRLHDIAPMLTSRQLDEMLAAAVGHDLWHELDGLLGQLDADGYAPLAARYAAADAPTVTAVEAATAGGEFSAESLAKLESR